MSASGAPLLRRSQRFALPGKPLLDDLVFACALAEEETIAFVASVGILEEWKLSYFASVGTIEEWKLS